VGFISNADKAILNALTTLNKKVDKLMSLVELEQTDLDTFATTIETETTAIGAAVTVVEGYIQTLLAGQAASPACKA
jgi:hypothetical protein